MNSNPKPPLKPNSSSGHREHSSRVQNAEHNRSRTTREKNSSHLPMQTLTPEKGKHHHWPKCDVYLKASKATTTTITTTAAAAAANLPKTRRDPTHRHLPPGRSPTQLTTALGPCISLFHLSQFPHPGEGEISHPRLPGSAPAD